MAQIINEYRGLGNALGEGLGQGIAGLGQGFGAGLQQLANMKLNQMAQRQQSQQLSNAFQQLPGITPEIANFLSVLSPEERKYPLQNLGSLIQLGQALGPQAAQHVAPNESGISALQGLTAADLLSNQNQVNPLAQQALSRVPLQQGQTAAPSQSPLFPLAQAPGSKGQEQLHVALGKQPASAQDQAKLIEDIFTSPQEKRERHKVALKERQIAQQEKAERFKITANDRKEILERTRTARQDLHDLNRMEELDKTGKLDDPAWAEFLQRAHIDIPALLMNPESEEFQKIAGTFLRNAKQYFGGRISNFEVEQFLKTIPSLSQTPEGRKRVIANLKYLKRGDLAYNEALKEIMKENDGIPPYDLLEQIDDRIEPKLEKLSQRFKEDLARPVPDYGLGRKALTAVGAGLGSLIGLPGSIIQAVGGKGGAGGAAAAL